MTTVSLVPYHVNSRQAQLDKNLFATHVLAPLTAEIRHFEEKSQTPLTEIESTFFRPVWAQQQD